MRRMRLLAPILAVTVAGLGSPGTATTAATTTVLVGAGDIADCNAAGDEATAILLDRLPGTVFTVGDNAYQSGTAGEFASCYEPTWGRHPHPTRPSPGNHDYKTPGASGYYDYFGKRAGPERRGYYAYNAGAWRVYSLNSEVMTDTQVEWLKADLAAHPNSCSLAYWHRPRYSSGRHGNYYGAKRFWGPLYRAGVEVVVNGHDHNYERFAPMRPDGSRYWRGIQQFVVGTGGTALRPFADIKPNSLVRQSSAHGVLELELRDGDYSWHFISVDGSFTDSGTRRCRGRN
jgi:acid phosphatase type 7